MNAIIVVSKEKSEEKVTVNLHGPIPVITVYNRKYRMTHDDALTALDRTAEVLTR
jgi:flagellar assembly factor FliW